MLCRRAEMPHRVHRPQLPHRLCVAEYQASGTMHGPSCPPASMSRPGCPSPFFTPSTKAEEGHDENIDFEAAVALVGRDVAERAQDVSVELYRLGADRAAASGILVADTKFELGFVDELVVCDEVLTPDSSRFWPADQWEPGSTPPSFDKEPLRHYLRLDWDKGHHHRPFRRRSSRPPATATSTGMSGSPVVHWQSGRVAEFAVVVEVTLRKGVADPEGATIERSLPSLGFTNVSDVHVGKAIRFTVEATDEAAARARVDDLCARFLTNPVIEDAQVEVRALAAS